MAAESIIDLGGFEYLKTSEDEDRDLNDEINQSVQNKEIALNMWLNENRGVPVIYYRTLPDVDSTDSVLSEYSIKGVVEYKEMKIVVPDGIIPDEKSEYDIWGLTTDSFDAHISMAYFKFVFGDKVTPRNEDVVVIPRIKRAYKIRSNYNATGSVKQPLYYSIHLDNYDENTALLKSDEIGKKLNDMVISWNDLFAAKEELEMANTVSMQGRMSTLGDDKYRSFIHNNIQIVNTPVLFGKQILFNSYYDLSNLDAGVDAVKYMNKFSMDKSFAITVWINILGGETAIFSSDAISINYDGVSNITMTNNTGRQIHTIPIGALPLNTWQGFCFNFNNEFNTTTVSVWSMDNPNGSTRFDSTLRNVIKRQLKVSPSPFADNVLTMVAGNYQISNVRVWKTAVPDEYMQIALMSGRVDKAGAAYIIDNASIQFNIGKIGSGKIL